MEVRRSSGEHGVMTAQTSASRISRILRRSHEASASGNASATKPSAAKRAARSLTTRRREGVERRDGEPVLERVALRTRFTTRRPRTSAPLSIAPISRQLLGGGHRNALFRGFRELDIFYLN